MSEYAESSEESVADDFFGDPDFVFEANDTRSDDFDAESSEQSSVDSSQSMYLNDIQWDDTSLEPISKRKTMSELWNHYGILKMGGKIFAPTSKRYFCRPCFDDRKFKR